MIIGCFITYQALSTVEKIEASTIKTSVTKEKIVKYYELTEEDLFNVFYRFIKEANCLSMRPKLGLLTNP